MDNKQGGTFSLILPKALMYDTTDTLLTQTIRSFLLLLVYKIGVIEALLIGMEGEDVLS